MTSQQKAILLALLSVLLWSTAGSAFKLSLSYLKPLEMLLLANLAAVLVLLALNLHNRQFRLAFFPGKQGWHRSAILGLLNPFLYYAILFPAYDRLLAQEALVLNYLWPVILVLLSIPMLKQRLSWYQLAGVFIGFTGIIVIATEGRVASLQFTDGLGVALAAGSAVIWALYWIMNMKDQREILPKLLLNFCFGLIYCSIAMMILGWESPITFAALAGGTYIGLFEMGITFAIWLKALTLASNTAKVSNLIFLSPVLSMVWIYFLVGERILPSSLAGLGLILISIALQRLKTRSQPTIAE